MYVNKSTYFHTVYPCLSFCQIEYSCGYENTRFKSAKNPKLKIKPLTDNVRTSAGIALFELVSCLTTSRKWLLLAAHHREGRKWGGTGSDFKLSSELGLKSMFPGPCVPIPRSTLTLNPNPNAGNIEPWEHRALGTQSWPSLADAKENDATGAAVLVQLDGIFALKEEHWTDTTHFSLHSRLWQEIR